MNVFIIMCVPCSGSIKEGSYASNRDYKTFEKYFVDTKSADAVHPHHPFYSTQSSCLCFESFK